MICLTSTTITFTPPRQSNTLRKSSRGSTTILYLLDSLGGVFSPPKLEAERNLPYCPPLSSTQSISNIVWTFAIMERPVSFTGEDFCIVEITVRGAMLHLPRKDKMKVYSSSMGNKTVILDRFMISATPSYDIIRAIDGLKIGWIEKKLISITDSFDVYVEGKGGFGMIGLFKTTPAYCIEGDFRSRNFILRMKTAKL